MIMIMAFSFFAQQIYNWIQGDGSDTAAATQNGKGVNYADMAARDASEGGPRRYYEEGELDIESARVDDSGSAPAKQKGGEADPSYVHVNILYCVS